MSGEERRGLGVGVSSDCLRLLEIMVSNSGQRNLFFVSPSHRVLLGFTSTVCHRDRILAILHWFTRSDGRSRSNKCSALSMSVLCIYSPLFSFVPRRPVT